MRVYKGDIMVLINIDRLSDSELKYIAEQEELDNYASLSREEIIEALEEIYEDETVSSEKPENAKFIKTLTATESDVSQLPGVTPLPKNYNNTEIHCILRDSNWAYAFWGVSEAQKDKLAEGGPYRLVVKVCLAKSPEKSYDIEISHDDTSWTIELPIAGEQYYLQLNAKYENGHEVNIAKSETITSPISYFSTHANELLNPDTWSLLVSPLVSNGGETVTSLTAEIINNARKDLK